MACGSDGDRRPCSLEEGQTAVARTSWSPILVAAVSTGAGQARTGIGRRLPGLTGMRPQTLLAGGGSRPARRGAPRLRSGRGRGCHARVAQAPALPRGRTGGGGQWVARTTKSLLGRHVRERREGPRAGVRLGCRVHVGGPPPVWPAERESEGHVEGTAGRGGGPERGPAAAHRLGCAGVGEAEGSAACGGRRQAWGGGVWGAYRAKALGRIAQQPPAADTLQPTLLRRCGFRARLRRSVRCFVKPEIRSSTTAREGDFS